MAMKPCCRILIHHRNPAMFGFFPSPKCFHPFSDIQSDFKLNFNYNRKFHAHSPRILGFRSPTDRTRNPFCSPDLNWGQSRLFSGNCNGDRGVYAIAGVASNFRNYSTSARTHANEKNFESGMNVKPYVVERIDEEENMGRDQETRVEDDVKNVDNENSKGLNEASAHKEESEIEAAAWKLLRHAVVTYCDTPIGTMAANDPADKQPLNYDQVFIRDFVPSALAFLLKGEAEIVRNFLLHTMQLQSLEKTVDCFSPGQGLLLAS